MSLFGREYHNVDEGSTWVLFHSHDREVVPQNVDEGSTWVPFHSHGREVGLHTWLPMVINSPTAYSNSYV